MWLLLAACRDTVDLEIPVSEDETLPTVLSQTPCGACGGDCLIEELSYGAALHTTSPIDYAEPPPAGGPHNPCWAPWGMSEQPIEDDNFVHNLEHGGIVFLWSCEGCDSEVSLIEGIVEEKGIFTLATPYPDMDVPFAALSWGFRLTMSCLDTGELSSFYDAHVDAAPESLPSGPSPDCM